MINMFLWEMKRGIVYKIDETLKLIGLSSTCELCGSRIISFRDAASAK